MFYELKDIESVLEKLKFSKKNIQKISMYIQNQVSLYRQLNLDISKISVAVIGKKSSSISFIRIKDKILLPIEILDTSYTVLNNISSAEHSDASVLLIINFNSNYKEVEIIENNSENLKEIQLKRVKIVSYGVTDGIDSFVLSINQADIKSVEYDMLKKAVTFAFNEHFYKKVKDVNCYFVDFAV